MRKLLPDDPISSGEEVSVFTESIQDRNSERQEVWKSCCGLVLIEMVVFKVGGLDWCVSLQTVVGLTVYRAPQRINCEQERHCRALVIIS